MPEKTTKKEEKLAYGVYIYGHYEGEETSKLVKTKAGNDFQTKRIAIRCKGLQNEIVEVPLDFKPEIDENGDIYVNVQATSKTWDNEAKRFAYNKITYFIPKL